MTAALIRLSRSPITPFAAFVTRGDANCRRERMTALTTP
jgi:hypothetical protein